MDVGFNGLHRHKTKLFDEKMALIFQYFLKIF